MLFSMFDTRVEKLSFFSDSHVAAMFCFCNKCSDLKRLKTDKAFTSSQSAGIGTHQSRELVVSVDDNLREQASYPRPRSVPSVQLRLQLLRLVPQLLYPARVSLLLCQPFLAPQPLLESLLSRTLQYISQRDIPGTSNDKIRYQSTDSGSAAGTGLVIWNGDKLTSMSATS